MEGMTYRTFDERPQTPASLGTLPCIPDASCSLPITLAVSLLNLRNDAATYGPFDNNRCLANTE